MDLLCASRMQRNIKSSCAGNDGSALTKVQWSEEREEEISTLMGVAVGRVGNCANSDFPTVYIRLRNCNILNFINYSNNEFLLKDWKEYGDRVLGHIGNNNSVFECEMWYDESEPSVFNAPEYGRWYRSKEKSESLSFASYLLNKKWTLEEEFNNHILRFHQVEVSSIYFIKINFDIPGWIDSH